MPPPRKNKLILPKKIESSRAVAKGKPSQTATHDSNNEPEENVRRTTRSSSRDVEDVRNRNSKSTRKKSSLPPPVPKSPVSNRRSEVLNSSRRSEVLDNSRGRPSRTSRNKDDDEEDNNRSSASSDGSDNSEESAVSGNEGDGNEEENRPVWDMFKEFVIETRTKEEKKRKSLIQTIKEFKSKSENPIRAELFACVKSYVQNSPDRLRSLLEELTLDNIDSILEKKPYFSASENVKNTIVRVVRYILDSREEKIVLSFMNYLNLEVAVRKRESIEWRAFEMKKTENAPHYKLENTFDDSPIELASLDEMRHQTRKKLRRDLREKYDNDNMFVNTCAQENYVFFAVMDVQKIKNASGRGNRKVKMQYSTIILAFNPKLPYVCFHGKCDLDDLQLNIIRSIPGEYKFLRNLKLVDSGITPVYTSLCKVSSTSIMSSSTFKRQIEEEEVLEEQLGVKVLPASQQIAKRRRVLKNLIDDKQEGGFKTFSLEYTQSKAPDFPITFKFKAPKGNMDGLVADLFERRIWNNPTPYIKARDLKTNFLKLEVNEDDGSIEYDIDNSDEDSH